MLATKGNGAVATELHKWIMEKKCVPLCFCLCRNAVFSVSKSNPIRFNHHFWVAVFHKVWRLLPLWNGGFNANTNSSNKQCIQVRKATKTKNPKGRETKTWSRISLPKIMIPRPIKRWCELLYIQQDHRNKTLPTKELPKGSRTHAKPSGNRSWIPRCETRFQRLVFVWNSSLISTHRFQVFEVLSPSTWFYLFTTLVVFLIPNPGQLVKWLHHAKCHAECSATLVIRHFLFCLFGLFGVLLRHFRSIPSQRNRNLGWSESQDICRKAFCNKSPSEHTTWNSRLLTQNTCWLSCKISRVFNKNATTAPCFSWSFNGKPKDRLRSTKPLNPSPFISHQSIGLKSLIWIRNVWMAWIVLCTIRIPRIVEKREKRALSTWQVPVWSVKGLSTWQDF